MNKKNDFLSLNDAYQLMGVSSAMDDEALKKRFRKLSLKIHPDVNSSPDAAEKFVLLCKAYDTILHFRKTGEIKQHQKSTAATAESKEEKLKKAKEFVRKRAQMENDEALKEYEKIKSSFLFKVSPIITLVCFLLIFVLIYDRLSPVQITKCDRVSYSYDVNGTENGLMSETVAKLEYLDKKNQVRKLYMNDKNVHFNYRESFYLHQTSLLNIPVGVTIYTPDQEPVRDVIGIHMFIMLLVFMLGASFGNLIYRKPSAPLYFFLYAGNAVALTAVAAIVSMKLWLY